MQPTPKPPELHLANTGPDTPSINEPPVRVVIRQEQRTKPRTRTFWIGPADYHELLPVLALDLHPQPAIAG